MKYLHITLVLITLSLSSCKAQTLPLYLSHDEIAGAYYKDIDNDLDQFVGTWILTNDFMTFKIILKKREHVLNPFRNFYTDILVGEYQYIDEGIEQANTLNNIDLNPSDYTSNHISGEGLSRCDECLPGHRRLVHLYMKDPMVSTHSMRMGVSIFNENGINKLKVTLRQQIRYLTDDEVPVVPASYKVISDGQYILTKLQ